MIDSLIFSSIRYCNIIWGKCNKTYREHIQKCINFAAKVVSNGHYRKRDHVTPLLQKLDWPDFDCLLSTSDAAYVYKSIHKLSNASMTQFPTRDEAGCSQINLRNKSLLKIRRFKTYRGAQAPAVVAAKNIQQNACSSKRIEILEEVQKKLNRISQE